MVVMRANSGPDAVLSRPGRHLAGFLGNQQVLATKKDKNTSRLTGNLR